MEGLCGAKCNRCVLYKECGGCSCCEASMCKNNCRKCYSLCSKRAESVPYLQSIGGVQITLSENRSIELPGHIPVLPDLMREPPKKSLIPVIGIHGGNMLSRNGEKITQRYLKNGFAGALNVDASTKGILQFYVKDRTLEGFWDKRKDLYDNLLKMNFKAIIAPNFSVYEDAPRMDHLFNIRRSTVTYNEMLDKGLDVIPDISWYSKADLDRWIIEINKNNVKIIAFSFQVVDVELKASSYWKEYLLGFRYLCERIDPKVSVIIIGVTSPRRIKAVFEAAGGRYISVLNQSAYIQSCRGMISENRQADKTIKRLELLERNITYFNNLYSEMNNKYTLQEAK